MKNTIRILLIIFIAFMLLLGVANLYFFMDKSKTVITSKSTITTTTRNEYVKLSFSDRTCSSKTKVIYTFEDGKKIYSRCGDIYYYDEVNNKMTLGEALDNEIIIIRDITDKMVLIAALYDGGTNVFEYNNEFDNLANNSFRFEICRQINGKKDMLFLQVTSDNYMCA